MNILWMPSKPLRLSGWSCPTNNPRGCLPSIQRVVRLGNYSFIPSNIWFAPMSISTNCTEQQNYLSISIKCIYVNLGNIFISEINYQYIPIIINSDHYLPPEKFKVFKIGSNVGFFWPDIILRYSNERDTESWWSKRSVSLLFEISQSIKSNSRYFVFSATLEWGPQLNLWYTCFWSLK